MAYPISQFDGTTIGIELLFLRSNDRYRFAVLSVVIVSRPVLGVLLAILRSLNSASLPSKLQCVCRQAGMQAVIQRHTVDDFNYYLRALKCILHMRIHTHTQTDIRE